MYTINKFKLFFVLGISICFLICKTSFAESLKQESQDNVKKIIMMLNIGAKEFEEGVKDGKVVVAPEYEESQIFLKQAAERFSKISEKIRKEKELKKRTFQKKRQRK